MNQQELADTLQQLRDRGYILIEDDGDEQRVRPTPAGSAAIEHEQERRETVEPDARD